jgi:hypothetical protein
VRADEAATGTSDTVVGHSPTEVVTSLLDKIGQPQRHLSILLGAGASMAAGLPDLTTLSRQVAERLEPSARVEAERLLAGRNLEEVLSYLRLVRTLLSGSRRSFAGLTAERARDLDGQITQAIAGLVGREDGLPLGAHEHLASWLGRSLRPTPVEVFTTNYDLLVERALERRGVPYFDGFVGVFRGEFRPDLVDDDEAPHAPRLPIGWVRLWKLHGSVSWSIEGSEPVRVVRRGEYPVRAPGEMLAIYPSSEKYAESRRLPFLALSDRFRRALATPESTTLVVGFSFGDQHINELIFNAVERHQRSEVIALFRGAIPASVQERAVRFPNLTACGASEAIIGGQAGAFQDAPDAPGWAGGRLLVGDFATLTELISRTDHRPTGSLTDA